MTNIGAWPRSRIIWLSLTWVVLAAGALIATAIVGLRSLPLPPDDSGLAGISMQPGGLALIVLVLLGPPACLLLAWRIRRKQYS